MKAINCTQCGATMENVSERSTIVDCDYCGARILISEAPKAIPEPVEPPEFYSTEPSKTPTGTIITVVVVLAFGLPIISAIIAMKAKSSPPAQRPVYSAPSSPITYSTPTNWGVSADPPKPVPVVNYQPRISWDGPNDLEYFADPEVDISSVSHLSSEEVEKTVFKNRVVKLRVVINTEGEIDKVETISGHPILVEAATASAKRSIFRARSKPTTRVVTYTFRVLKD